MKKIFPVLAVLLCIAAVPSCKDGKKAKLQAQLDSIRRADSIFQAQEDSLARLDSINKVLSDSLEYAIADSIRREEEKPQIERKSGDELKRVEAGLAGALDGVAAESEKKALQEALPAESVGKKASFNGGDATDFLKWVEKAIVYPQVCKEQGIEGKPIVSFVVDKTGKVGSVKLLKSSGDKNLDQEALRVVSSSPTWAPAEDKGTAVNVRYTLPVLFELR